MNAPSITGEMKDQTFQRDFQQFLSSPEMQKVVKEEQERNAQKLIRRKQKFVARELQQADEDTRKLVGPFVQMPFVADLLISMCDDIRDSRSLSEKLQEPRLRALFQRLGETAKNEGNDLTRVQEEWYHSCVNIIQEQRKGKKDQRMRMGTETLVPMMNAASACKADGNKAFRSGNMKEALECYTKGVQTLVSVSGSSLMDSNVVDELLIALLLNQSAAALKLEEFTIARDATKRILDMEKQKDNVKALFRYGIACGKLHEIENARKALNHALEIEPDCEDAKRALIQLDEDLTRWSNDEKELCRRMFSSSH